MKFSGFHLTRDTIALSIKALSILGVTMIIYFRDLIIIANEAMRSDLMNYTLAIPFLFAYLIYRKRKMLRATIPFETARKRARYGKPTYMREIVGALLCLTAFLLYWHGSYTFYQSEYHIVSMPLFVAGLILIIFNTKTLIILAFPIAFLFLLTPPPSEIAYMAGARIATLNSEASYAILKALGLPVSLTTEYGAPTLVATNPSGSSISFVIGAASSGIYSTIGFSIFAIFLSYITRGQAWKKVTLFFASLPLIFTLNILRIIILVSVGYWHGVNIAWDIFHLSGGGVLISLGSLIMIMLSKKILTTKPKTLPCPSCNPSTKKDQDFCQACGKILRNKNIHISKRDLGKMAALLTGTLLIINLQVPVLAMTEGPPEVLIQTLGGEPAATSRVLPEIPGYALGFVYRDERFEEIAHGDRALVYAYRPTDTSARVIWVAIEIGSSRATWHSWEGSVITWPQKMGRPPTATQLDLRDIHLLQNPPITARYFAFQDLRFNITQVVLYWYESAMFNTGSGSEHKYMKISLIAYLRNPEGVPESEEELRPFGKAIVNYWQPIKTWSAVALVLAQNATALVSITTTMLLIILALEFLKERGKKKSNLVIYDKLASEEEKFILQAIYLTSKEDKPAINAIASHYQELAGKPIEPAILLRKLNEAVEAGLVRMDITSREDEPTIIWKSQTPAGRIIY